LTIPFYYVNIAYIIKKVTQLKDTNNKLKNILFIAGIIEIIIGLIHFIMPYFVYKITNFGLLPQNESDFIILCVLSVGILLIAFGLVTILLTKKLNLIIDIMYIYIIIQIILWIMRVSFELIYPLNIDMFYINPFTNIVLPGLVIELLLFIVSFILIKKEMKSNK